LFVIREIRGLFVIREIRGSEPQDEPGRRPREVERLVV
jgi:hypothetical protein